MKTNKPLDYSTITIEKDPPIPTVHEKNSMLGLLKKMEVGDSFTLPYSTPRAWSTVGISRSKLGIKLAIRKISENECRVWRIK